MERMDIETYIKHGLSREAAKQYVDSLKLQEELERKMVAGTSFVNSINTKINTQNAGQS